MFTYSDCSNILAFLAMSKGHADGGRVVDVMLTKPQDARINFFLKFFAEHVSPSRLQFPVIPRLCGLYLFPRFLVNLDSKSLEKRYYGN